MTNINEAGALVTGASSGIGADIARSLARRGARLAIVARRGELLDALADKLEAATGKRPTAIVADLSVGGAAATVADQATASLGAVDILVNNAGAAAAGLQWHLSDTDAARDMFELNVWSPLALTGALVPAMLERGRGHVVNVTSMSQIQAWPGLSNYSAAKAALALATETLRLELHGTGVHVLEVIPGPTETATQAEIHLLPGIDAALRGVPVGDPAVLGERVAHAIEHRRKKILYPRVMWLSYLRPGITRTFVRATARRVGDQIDRNDSRVLRSGSQGDEEAQEARAAWARSQAQ